MARTEWDLAYELGFTNAIRDAIDLLTKLIEEHTDH